jgi:hypothetical protein
MSIAIMMQKTNELTSIEHPGGKGIFVIIDWDTLFKVMHF